MTHHHHEPATRERDREILVTGGPGDGTSAGVIIGVVLAVILVLFVVWMLAFDRGGDRTVIPDEVDITIETPPADTGGEEGGG